MAPLDLARKLQHAAGAAKAGLAGCADAHAGCQGALEEKAEKLRPMKNTRLGGDVTSVYHLNP